MNPDYIYSISDDQDDGIGTVMVVVSHPKRSTELALADLCAARRLRNRMGYQSLQLCFAYAAIADTLDELQHHSDPVGEQTDTVLLDSADKAQRVIITWTDQGDERLIYVQEMLKYSRLFFMSLADTVGRPVPCSQMEFS